MLLLGCHRLGGSLFVVIYRHLKQLPYDKSMLEGLPQLIYETCKTYLRNQGEIIWLFLALHRRHHGGLLWFSSTA